MRRSPVAIILALLVSVGAAGCLDPYRPLVSAEALESAGTEWTVTELGEVSNGALGPNVVETEYRYHPDNGDEETPAVLILIGIRTFNPINTDDLLDRTREIVEQALRDEGVTADPEQESEGERETNLGSPTKWFTLVGTAESDSPLFSGEEEVRVIGEAWYDGRSKTHVVAVGLAQTTTTGFLGSETRDHSVWNQIVGDDDGTIGGAVNASGFIINVQSHG